MYCKNCGNPLSDFANVCPQCGEPKYHNNNNRPVSDKSWVVTLLLSIFLGEFGIHSFYAGKTGVGILQLITFGGFGIWYIIDSIMIATQNNYDSDGYRIER